MYILTEVSKWERQNGNLDRNLQNGIGGIVIIVGTVEIVIIVISVKE